jgi:alkylresorcinol/alkylpyrone synthase
MSGPNGHRPPGRPTRLRGLATCSAESPLAQAEVLDTLGLRRDDTAVRIFSRAAVLTRDLDLGPEMLASTLQGRTRRMEDHLLSWSLDAVSQLDVEPEEIGVVVTASLYSLGGPTLAHRLVEHLGLAPSTDKYHIVGVGCASAVPLFRLVSQALVEVPGRKGLVVAAESMSGLMTRAEPEDHRAKTVGAAIFGDGCAAAVLDRAPGGAGPAIVASQVHQIGGTLDAVRMELSDLDGYLYLDRALPDLAAEGIRELVDGFLAPLGLARADVDHWVVHPGGRRILECVGAALELDDEQLEVSYDVLSHHGNVGTPSIFYVLGATISRRSPGPGERALLVTVGPGITVGLMLLAF